MFVCLGRSVHRGSVNLVSELRCKFVPISVSYLPSGSKGNTSEPPLGDHARRCSFKLHVPRDRWSISHDGRSRFFFKLGGNIMSAWGCWLARILQTKVFFRGSGASAGTEIVRQTDQARVLLDVVMDGHDRGDGEEEAAPRLAAVQGSERHARARIEWTHSALQFVCSL